MQLVLSKVKFHLHELDASDAAKKRFKIWRIFSKSSSSCMRVMLVMQRNALQDWRILSHEEALKVEIAALILMCSIGFPSGS